MHDFHEILPSKRELCKNRLSDADLLLKSVNDISLVIFMLANFGTVRYKMCPRSSTEQYVSFVRIGIWKAIPNVFFPVFIHLRPIAMKPVTRDAYKLY